MSHTGNIKLPIKWIAIAIRKLPLAKECVPRWCLVNYTPVTAVLTLNYFFVFLKQFYKKFNRESIIESRPCTQGLDFFLTLKKYGKKIQVITLLFGSLSTLSLSLALALQDTGRGREKQQKKKRKSRPSGTQALRPHREFLTEILRLLNCMDNFFVTCKIELKYLVVMTKKYFQIIILKLKKNLLTFKRVKIVSNQYITTEEYFDFKD